jgi:hypothetical protein
MMLCATSLVTIIAAIIGFPFRKSLTRHAPSVCIGCWLAFCTRHVTPRISPKTSPWRRIAVKSAGVIRLTAAPVSYSAVIVGDCDVASFFSWNVINGLREGLASSFSATQNVNLFSQHCSRSNDSTPSFLATGARTPPVTNARFPKP